MKKICAVLLVVTVLFSAMACKKKTDVIQIGVAGPMTGDQSKMGMDFRNGVTLAVEEWNLKGGVLGKKIELMIGDDQKSHRSHVVL